MYFDPAGHDATLIYYNNQYYTLQELDRKENWNEVDRTEYTMSIYKNSNESQDLTNIGRVLYESKGKWDYDRLEDVGFSRYQANGLALNNANVLNNKFRVLKEAIADLELVQKGKLKLSDTNLKEKLNLINYEYYYLNSVLGIDFDEDFSPIENDNLYFAYGVKTKHHMDFEDSLIFSDVGLGFEGIAQNFRLAQMITAISGGMGYKNGQFKVDFYNNKVPSTSDASISKLDSIELNGVKPTNYTKPTIVKNLEGTGNAGVGGNKGIINGKNPAQRLADKLSTLPKNQRPNSVTVIRTQSGKYIVSTNKTKYLNTEVSNVLDDLGNVNSFNRGCGEVSAVSRSFDKGFQSELAGADVYTAYVRGSNSTTGLNGAYHSPCDVCGPMLDFFKMNPVEW